MHRALIVLLVLVVPLAARAAPGDVVVSEVAWMGSDASATDEWIELYNATSWPIDLTGWTLQEGTASHLLSGIIPGRGFFLIERREEASSAPSSAILPLSLVNGCESLALFDAATLLVDQVGCGATGWYAGRLTAPRASMERSQPSLPGDAPSSWHTNDGLTWNGTDSLGQPFAGTPGATNSSAGDQSPPTILGVHGFDPTSVMVRFDEPVTPATALIRSAYLVNGSVRPTSVTAVGTDGTRVRLSGLAGLAPSSIATLEVFGIQDAAGNAGSPTARYVVGVQAVAYVQVEDADGMPTVPADVYVTVEGWVAAAAAYSPVEAQLYDATGGVTLYDPALVGALYQGQRLRASGLVTTYYGKTELGVGAGTVQFEPLAPAPAPILVLEPALWVADPERYEGLPLGLRAMARVAGVWPAAGSSTNLTFASPSGATLTVRVDQDTDIDGSTEPAWPQDLVGVSLQYDTTVPYTDGHQVLPRSLADLGAALCTCAPDTMDAYWCLQALDVCEVVDCRPGLQDCDGVSANGCESSRMTDRFNCGACRNVCPGSQPCVGGVCGGACADLDEDGYLPVACGGEDCDDTRPWVHPGAVEVCESGFDEDCDGQDAACPVDGGVADGGPWQADGGPWETDGGPWETDGGPWGTDGGPWGTDGGADPDAGPAPDASFPDGGVALDGGEILDSGEPVDGGSAADGGAPDAGGPVDRDEDSRGFGCGCSASRGLDGAGLMLLLMGALLVMRRRL